MLLCISNTGINNTTNNKGHNKLYYTFFNIWVMPRWEFLPDCPMLIKQPVVNKHSKIRISNSGNVARGSFGSQTLAFRSYTKTP